MFWCLVALVILTASAILLGVLSWIFRFGISTTILWLTVIFAFTNLLWRVFWPRSYSWSHDTVCDGVVRIGRVSIVRRRVVLFWCSSIRAWQRASWWIDWNWSSMLSRSEHCSGGEFAYSIQIQRSRQRPQWIPASPPLPLPNSP